MPVFSEERTKFLHSIMITALEGGVGYWSVADGIVRHEDDDLWYHHYHLYCSDGGKEPLECGNGKDDPCKGHRVTRGIVAHGLKLAKVRPTLDRDIKAHILLGDAENDGGEIDAWAADVIVQLGIFEDIIYG